MKEQQSAAFTGACREFCPVQKSLDNTHDRLRDTAQKIQTLALQDAINQWHSAFYISEQTGSDTVDIYTKIENRSNTSIVSEIAEVTTDFTAEQKATFLYNSRQTAIEVVESVFLPMQQANRGEADLKEARCRIGPQIARVAIDSKQPDDPFQGAKQNLVICHQDRSISPSPITEDDAHWLKESIAQDRDAQVIANILADNPEASATLSDYAEKYPDEMRDL